MPFLKNIRIDNIQNVTVMVNSSIDIRHAIRPDGRIHICFADSDSVLQDTLVDFQDGTGLAISDKTSHIDLLIDTDAEHLDALIIGLLRIRNKAKKEGLTNNRP